MEKEHKLENDLNEQINKLQESIDGRGEIIRLLIADGLKEIEIRNDLKSLKRKIEQK
ncbi:MAG: hypothetical protein ACTIDZ_03955 [Staphylococcus sp.]|uniref:hypothetical protein n=1 Tax=Staphylococcus sp. TaxID=29387 RepID=UPI003F95E86F